MTFISLVPQIYYNVKQYGAVANGTTDDTTAIGAAITAASSAGGGYVFLPGTCAISSPLTLPTKVWLCGAGPGTGLKALAGFTGAEMIYINTADWCGVRDMQIIGGPNTSSATNPSVTAAIEVASSRFSTLKNLQIYYVNGWAIEIASGASVNCSGGVMDAIHMNHTAKGIHMLGTSATNFVGQHFLTNIHPEVVDNGDGVLLEDINDVEITNLNGATAGGAVAGNMIHLKGQNASHFFANLDLGVITAPSSVSATILIEHGTNGDATNVTFLGGVSQGGLTNVLISTGSDINFVAMKFKQAGTDGVQVTSSQGPVIFDNCEFGSNNQNNVTAYDINITQSTGNTYVKNCHVESGVGSGVGLVTNPFNDTSHRAYVFNTHFSGAGTTSANCFATTPQIVRGCPGYNPRGSITPTAIGASPFTGNASQNDIQIIFTAINTMTVFSIGGVSIGGVPVAFVPYRVPARQSFTITYTGAAPTYLWFAD